MPDFVLRIGLPYARVRELTPDLTPNLYFRVNVRCVTPLGEAVDSIS